jgi:YVTN family beta-propeller protein
MLRLLLLLPLLALAACDDALDQDFRGDVLVVNQGNFSDGNGSITRYSAATGAAATPVTGLGSILQSLYVDGGTIYVAANTAARVDVFDAATLQRTGQITGLVSPRYMVRVGTRLYVTNLYADPQTFSGGSVSVIDVGQRRVVRTIPVGNNPEGIVAVGNRIFVANHGFGAGSTVSVIDASSDAVVSTVNVDCEGPRTLVVDPQQEVWAVCTGRTRYDANFNVIGRTPGALRVLDGNTGVVKARIAVTGPLGAEGPGQDAARQGRWIYVVQEAKTVLRFDTASNLQEGGFTVTGAPIGAIGHDGTSLYLGRVPGFTTAGTVTLHSSDGTETGRFTAGVAPTFLAFLGRGD